ncbi:hypothetical protein K505DRAFT_239106 [Melanomma pulvis-pyrius CBS 109.77]|uniref:HNH nuclease domain-containing protein n=1 Tax=Melanomma pulvis-pyrius CBS 109.77 TaxID=1314802 RepID=A0A6A6XHU2_9PLEO|nr:hypothetical protein K505DRAFT_239106 [Melanomma pulvis-pyrius CBS 109.77]
MPSSSQNEYPIRASGKRPATEVLNNLESELTLKRVKTRESKKELKPSSSFDSTFWHKAAEYALNQKDEADAYYQVQLFKYTTETKGKKEEFDQIQEAEELIAQAKAHDIEHRLCLQQAQRLETGGDAEKSKRRTFMRLFTGSVLGLGIQQRTLGLGRRDTTIQSNFRQDVIKEYGLKHPGGRKYEDMVWDIVTGTYIHEMHSTASHLFSVRHGQDMMVAIFGEESKTELFSPRNALLLPVEIEKYFDSALFVIVPAIKHDASRAELPLWEQTNPRNYKIKILDFEHPSINQVVVAEKTWKMLDDHQLQFKNSFRPRARYLYFNYCVQLLRLSWKKGGQVKALPGLKAEVGKGFWGTKGKYLPMNQLKAFVEELGHEYDGLLDGGDDTVVKEGDDDVLLAAIVGQVKDKNKGESSDEDDEDDEEV